MRYLGVDYGKKRVGIALSDEKLEFALPKAVLPNDNSLIKKIKEFCEQNEVFLIVIGESKNYNGVENAIMEDARSFEKEIKGVTGINTVFEPEFMTSAEANRINEPGRSPRREKGAGARVKFTENEMLDASAAALILKSYLNRIKQ